MPVLTGKAAPYPRKLFWRYKANHQRAMRDGDWKILKIKENSFLFNVADDPMERANLKTKHPDIFTRLAADWTAWNTTMLPEVRESSTGGISADQLADHIGAALPSLEPDPGMDWPK
jgi:arylsulfatase A-like enzyme